MKLMLVLSTLAARPSVHVDTHATGPELRDWLIVRLSEEGFELAPRPDGAEVDLRVSPVDGGWIVEADALDQQRYVVAAGPIAVQRLEVLHRAVAAIEEVRPRPDVIDDAVPRVAIELRAEAPADAREELAARITLAVLAAGGRVAPPGGEHDRVVCVGPTVDAAIVIASGSTQCGQAQVVAIADAPEWILGDLVPAVAETELDSVAAANDGSTAPKETAPSEPEPVGPAVQSERPFEPPQPDPRPRVDRSTLPLQLRVGVRAGLVARLSPVDPAVGVDVRLGRTSGPAAWVDVQVWPSLGETLSVVETLPAAGLRWRFVPHDRVALDIGALCGVAVHSYRSEVRQGRRYDVSGELAAALAIRIVRRLELELELRAGRSGRTRIHDLGAAGTWARDAWRIAAFAGVGWGFQIGGPR